MRTQQITDVELGRLPLSTLRKYSAIVFPGHSEYYEPATYDLLKRYRDDGGNLVFLQANPFYRQVRLDPASNAIVLTDYDAREGRSDFALTGVGYDGCCFPKSRAEPYVAASGKDYDRVRWLYRGTGIGPGQPFGVANSESDRVDPGLSPRDHVIAAQAILRGKYGVIHAALTWSHAGRGQVVATGNYTFLRMGRGITYKLLDNVWASSWASAPCRARSRRVRWVVGGEAADAAAGAPARADGARSGEGERPTLAERLARALLGADALLGHGRHARPSRVVGRRPERARLDVPPAQGHPLERRLADHGCGFPPGLAARARGRTRPRRTQGRLGIVRGARRFHATGQGGIGVQVLDDHTLRVTLQHPVPWFDELAALPVTAPVPPRPWRYSGPFRLVSHNGGQLVLERNFNYWDAKAVKPSQLVLLGVEGRRRSVAAAASRSRASVDRHRRPPAGELGRASAARDRPAPASTRAHAAAERPRHASVRRLRDHAREPRHRPGSSVPPAMPGASVRQFTRAGQLHRAIHERCA